MVQPTKWRLFRSSTFERSQMDLTNCSKRRGLGPPAENKIHVPIVDSCSLSLSLSYDHKTSRKNISNTMPITLESPHKEFVEEIEPTPVATGPQCRFCATPLKHTFVDLGMSPLCESYVSQDHLNKTEAFYPLHVRVCDQCFLVQLDEFVTPAHIFTEYAYFSSY